MPAGDRWPPPQDVGSSLGRPPPPPQTQIGVNQQAVRPKIAPLKRRWHARAEPVIIEPLTGELVVNSVATLDERSGSRLLSVEKEVFLASHNGIAYVLWEGWGSHQKLNLAWSHDAYQFAGKRTLRHRTYRSSTGSGSGAALTGMQGGLAVAARVSKSSKLGVKRLVGPKVLFSDDGFERASAVPVSDGKSSRNASVSIAEWRGKIVVLLSQPLRDDPLLMSTQTEGKAFSAPVQIANSASWPSVLTLEDELIIGWMDTEGAQRVLKLLQSQGGHLPASPMILPLPSVGRIKLGSFGGELVAAWTEKNLGVLIGFLRNGMLVPAARLALPAYGSPFMAMEPVPPSFCEHNGQLLMAWSAEQIHVASLRRA